MQSQPAVNKVKQLSLYNLSGGWYNMIKKTGRRYVMAELKIGERIKAKRPVMRLGQ